MEKDDNQIAREAIERQALISLAEKNPNLRRIIIKHLQDEYYQDVNLPDHMLVWDDEAGK